MILAAGGGRRMRVPAPGVALASDQKAVANAGLKGLIPVAGRPFLDHSVDALEEAGLSHVCLVVPPAVPEFAVWARSRRDRGGASVETAVQPEPLGTADAVLAAASFVDGEPFLVLNSDNLYPAKALSRLIDLAEGGLLAVERLRARADPGGNLDDRRLAEFAALEVDSQDRLLALREKPGWETYQALPDPLLLSVNCWKFDPSIFEHCRRVAPSLRGELELPAAVARAIEHGTRFQVVSSPGAVLDLSTRRDVVAVERRLLRDSR